ncbi:DUF6924 domain-containing protein [Kribbella sp. NPDC002412]
MPTLPRTDSSLLVRTDFASDTAWQHLSDEAQRENEDGFRAYIETVSDPAFDGADWQAIQAAVPVTDTGASVLFIADTVALGSAEHPILVVALGEGSSELPFRTLPSELWAIENNLNIANMDWQEFAAAVDEDGVFRGFGD